MTKLIELSQISRVFRTKTLETHALSNINLVINEKDYVAITGKSGSGKSTLLNILGLLDSPSSGQYSLLKHKVDRLSKNQLANLRNTYIGYVFQSFNLIVSLTVFENIALPLMYAGKKMEEIKPRVTEIAEKMGISHRLNHLPSILSGGEIQRVAICRALANSPKLIILDEPTGNLDSENANMVMDLIDELHQSGTTICLVTHDSEFAQRASRIIVIQDGKIVNANK